ncbi:MAG: enoyl-CoA hydratase-related protein [Aliidongia sp.]
MAGIELAWSGGLARLRFAEPANRNAFNLAFCQAFAQIALDVAAALPSAILIEAQGEAFSVGGDIAEFLAERARVERHVFELASLFHLGIARLHGTGAPILVAVNGIAAGGGFSLVCGADLAIAARSAKLVAAYTASGLTPDGGGTWFLPRLVGWQKAFEILALNPVLSAEEAQRLGLVTRVVEDTEFPAAVDALAESVAAMPSGALVALKRLMRLGTAGGLDAALDAEAASIARQAGLASTLERLDAFMARGGKSR